MPAARCLNCHHYRGWHIPDACRASTWRGRCRCPGWFGVRSVLEAYKRLLKMGIGAVRAYTVAVLGIAGGGPV